MPVQLDHLIVLAHDKRRSAQFLADILGLDAPEPAGYFVAVQVTPSLTFDYADGADFPRQHYAFLVGEDDFDAAFARIQERELDFWADPRMRHPREINHNDGGRGVYFQDPSGHFLELITRRYGSGEG